MTDVPVPNKRKRPGASFFLEVVLAGLLVFAVAVTIGLVTDAPTGSVADWVAAIATVAAFGAAVIAAWYAGQALRVEQERDARRDDTERRSQASLVAADMDIEWQAEFTSHGVLPGEAPQVEYHAPALPAETTLVVQNASPLPVYGMTLHVYASPTDNDPVPYWLADYEIGNVDSGVNRHGITFTPESLARIEARARAGEDWPPSPGDDYQPLNVTLGWTFVDTAGRKWKHWPGGRLTEVTPESGLE